MKSWDGPTKNGKTRTQALLPRSLRALRVWHRLAGRPSIGLLFPSPHKGKNASPKRHAYGYDWGRADSPSTAQGLRPGWWRRVAITTRVRFHDMRDNAATHLLSGTWGTKWPIKEVSEHLGHSSVKVTEDRYAHLTIDAKLETARATESKRNTRRTQGGDFDRLF
jgi:integrase